MTLSLLRAWPGQRNGFTDVVRGAERIANDERRRKVNNNTYDNVNVILAEANDEEKDSAGDKIDLTSLLCVCREIEEIDRKVGDAHVDAIKKLIAQTV
jgi:hypothetical protein